MTDGLSSIIKQLERQVRAIERALAALRDIEGIPAPAARASAPAARKGGMTPAGRRRISLAQKKRWAARRAAEGAAAASPAQTAPRKVGITPAGRKRLAEAMKRRWAVKRAASAVKKTARKTRAAKKAA